MKEKKVNFIDEPFFSVAELAHIAGVDRALADQWIHRGLIKPTRVARAGTRNRPIFSVRAIFKAKLICILNDHFLFAPGQSAPVANDSDSKQIADVLAVSAKLADLLAGEDWMYAAAREIDRGRPIKFFVAATRVKKCWRWRLISPDEGAIEPFGPGVPYIMMPLPDMFLPVYSACRAMHGGMPLIKTQVGRARH